MGTLKSLAASAVLALGLTLGITGGTSPAQAAGEAVALPSYDWEHGGVFGTFDRASAQRGFQVYNEVCSGCHGLYQMSYRHLAGIGFSEAQIRAVAAQYFVPGEPDEFGEISDRPARPSDKFARPFANENAARFANNGAYPPDLSTIVKARAGREDYIMALLTGYVDPPADFTLGTGMYYNEYFSGHQIAMAPPLYDDGVVYSDGTEATVAQQAKDLSVFLTWASHPYLEDQKEIGVRVILFLIVFTFIMYAVKRKIWANKH